MCKTYDVKDGFIGYDNEERHLFPTDDEAVEYFREKKKEKNEDEDS